jgi:hypothetical protein
MMLAKVLGLSIGLIVSSAAVAASLQIGQPQTGGNGCPQGTVSATVDPSGQAVSFLFDQYIAEAGAMTGKRLDRKSCNIAIPIQVPNGYSVALLKVDYRGYNFVPVGGQNRFDVEYFWAGSRGPRISKTFRAPSYSRPLDDNFSLTDLLQATTVVWSKCGESVNFRINSSLTAQSNSAMQQTMAVLDSADVSGELKYHFQFRPCW